MYFKYFQFSKRKPAMLQKSTSAANISTLFDKVTDSLEQAPHSVEYYKLREKLYLDIIVELTNKNKHLENQLNSQQQRIQNLESELQSTSPTCRMIRKPQHQSFVCEKMYTEVPRNSDPEIVRLSTEAHSEQIHQAHKNSASNLLKNSQSINLCVTNKRTQSEIQNPKYKQFLAKIENERLMKQACPNNSLMNESTVAQAKDLTSKNIHRRNIYVAGAADSQMNSIAIPFKPLTFSNKHISKPTLNCPEEPKSPYENSHQKINSPERKANSGFYELLTNRFNDNKQRLGASLNKEQYLSRNSETSGKHPQRI